MKKSNLFAAAFAATTVHPAGTLLDNAPHRDHFLRVQNEVIERLVKEGVI